jgi:hypothetical protein
LRQLCWNSSKTCLEYNGAARNIAWQACAESLRKRMIVINTSTPKTPNTSCPHANNVLVAVRHMMPRLSAIIVIVEWHMGSKNTALSQAC